MSLLINTTANYLKATQSFDSHEELAVTAHDISINKGYLLSLMDAFDAEMELDEGWGTEESERLLQLMPTYGPILETIQDNQGYGCFDQLYTAMEWMLHHSN